MAYIYNFSISMPSWVENFDIIGNISVFHFSTYRSIGNMASVKICNFFGRIREGLRLKNEGRNTRIIETAPGAGVGRANVT